MKRYLLCLILALTFATATAQDDKTWLKKDGERPKFELPDSLMIKSWVPYKYSETEYSHPLGDASPVISMSSITVEEAKKSYKKVQLLNNNVLRLGRTVTVSNGQAWNWGPYPNSFLDARTLSFPAPR